MISVRFLLKVLICAFFSLSEISALGQTLSPGDIAIIGVGVDNEEVLLVALTDIPAGESVFFTDDEWLGSLFDTGEGFYEWVTPVIQKGDVFTFTTSSVSAGGTVTQRSGSLALGNSGDGIFIYQTSTNVFNTGAYTILGFAGEDSSDAGDLISTGLTIGTNAVYFGGDNGIYNGSRTGQNAAGFLSLIYDNTNWVTSGSSQTFNLTDFTFPASPEIMVSEGSVFGLFGSVTVGTSSNSQTFTVSGTDLTADITITAPTGFEVSLDNVNWFSSRTITPIGGTVSSTTVFVRFTPASAVPISTLVSITSTGASGTSVNVSGTGINPNNSDSRVLSPLGQIAAKTMTAANVTTSGNATDVFTFTINDPATSDELNTIVNQVRVVPGASNTADWTDFIQGVRLHDGNGFITIGSATISDTEIIIPISSGDLEVADGASVDVTLYVYLNTANIVDGQILDFSIPSTSHGFVADAAGSGFATTFSAGSIEGNNITVDVNGTALTFVQQPTNTEVNTAMSPAVTIEAVDANGNRDTDYSSNISITSTGTLTGSPVSEAAVSGLAMFSALTHSAIGTGLELTAGDGSLSDVVSSAFNINLPVTTIDFDTASYWTAGSSGLTSYAYNHVYAEENWEFTGGPALRNASSSQDGYPGALGDYSWRLQNTFGVIWTATYGTDLPTGDYFTQFGFSARRWDGSPSPNATVEYSVDGGSNWATASSIGESGTLNNTAFGNSSDWVTFTQSITSPASLDADKFIVRITTGSTERIMIDNFTYTIATPPPTVPTGVATGTAGSVTAISAVLSGNNVATEGGAAITERGVAYGTSSNPTTTDSTKTDAGTTGTFDVTLNNLNSSTTYYVRAYATNSYGTIYGNEVSFTTGDANSDVVENSSFTYPTNIDYTTAVNSGPLTSTNSIEVAQFTIRDGGDGTDADALSTALTGVNLDVTEHAQLDRIALFDGLTNIAEVAASSSIAFSSFTLEALDNGTKDFSIRVSFKSTVTDNKQLQFAVTAATAQAGGSLFAAADAGGAASSMSGDDNRIEVTATALAFVQQPGNKEINFALSPAITIEALDDYENRDLDYGSNISITSSGTLANSPVSVAAVSGLATFSSLTHTALGTGLALTASDGTLADITSNSFNIFAPLTIISCDSLSVGDTFEVEIDGIKDTLTVVNRAMLDSMITNGGNFTEVCATKVTDMSYLFENQGSFDVDITKWDMSNVTNTEGMFKNAKSFNQDISNWDVSNVTNMRMMFSGAQDFNQDIGNWDVSNVTNMRGMFYGAHSFSKDLSSWDVSRVQDMSWMFGSTRKFNGNISGWNVSNVTNMDFMFSQAWEFNQPLSNWNVYNVNSMRGMFFWASNFNQDLSAWCVGNYINSKPPFFDKTSVFGNANLLSPSQSPAWQVPCGPTYPSGSVNCTSLPTIIVDVTNPTTGATWMDRNLGATQTATSSTDANAYGDLYQWGRGADGHQCRNSSTTSTLSSTDQPGHASFIPVPGSPYDWRSPQNTSLWQGVNGENNPCPNGYRLPTEAEFNAERLSWSSNNAAGAISAPLKWAMAGRRLYASGAFSDVGSMGLYWSSTPFNLSARYLFFTSGTTTVATANRASARSIRCIKD